MHGLRSIVPSANGLFAFEAAARHGSFTRAAAELNVSQAAVSYAVKRLEAFLGVALFERHHRRVALTEAGQRFHRDVSIGLSHIAASARDLRRRDRGGHVTLSISTAFATYWMLPRLARFRQAHPAIDLRLQTTDQDLDLAAEGIALGIRHGKGDWSDYESALFMAEEVHPVCSPGYLSAFGRIRAARELPRHTLIHLDEPYRKRMGWSDWFAAAGIDSPWPEAGLRLNDYALVIHAALEGQGVALGWRHLTQGLVEQGHLVRPVSNAVRTGAGFYVVAPRAAPADADAAAVRDWLIAEARAMTERARVPGRVRRGV